MKKVFIFAIALAVAGVANAQTSSKKSTGGPQFGLKAGANLSNIVKTGNRDFKTEFKPGFNAGLFVEIPIVDKLSFAPELMYSQKGYKRTGNSFLFNDPTEYSVTTNFIEIPVLAKIKASNSFSIVVGPQVSFLSSTTEKFTQGSSQAQSTVKADNENLKKSLVGGVVGIGIDITPKVSLNGRYALDFQKNNENGTTETPEYKNQVISASLGFKF